MPPIIGRAPQCPACKVKEIGIVSLPDGPPNTGQIIAHTPGFGSVRPAQKRCKGSGVKMKMAAPPKKKARPLPAAPPPRVDIRAIREAQGQITEPDARKRLADIASIIEGVNERAFQAVANSDTAIMKATRLEMTDLEMRTIYEIATGTLVLPEATA